MSQQLHSIKENITIISHNINGGFERKIDDIEQLAIKENVDFFLLQEVHMTKEKSAIPYHKLSKYYYENTLLTQKMCMDNYVEKKTKNINRIYKDQKLKRLHEIKQINKNNARANGGLITLINKKWQNKIQVIKDVNCRYLFTNLLHNNQLYIIINIYAPAGNNKHTRENHDRFLERLKIKIYKIVKEAHKKNKNIQIHYILGGDLNVVLNDFLDRETLPGYKNYINNKTKKFRNFMSRLNLTDVYRNIYPNYSTKAFTYQKYSQKNNNRITKFYKYSNIPRNKRRKITNTNTIKKKETIFSSRARLDYFLIKSNKTHNINKIKVLQNTDYISDHLPLIFQYRIDDRFINNNKQKTNKKFIPKIKTKQAGMKQIKEIGKSLELTQHFKKKFEDWEKCKNNHKNKQKQRDELFKEITEIIKQHYQKKLGTTLPFKKNFKNPKAFKDPEILKLKIIRRKCEKLLNAIHKYKNNKKTKEYRIIARTNTLKPYWEFYIENKKDKFIWVQGNENDTLIIQTKILRNRIIKKMKYIYEKYKQIFI